MVNWGPPAPGARVFENYGSDEAKNMVARLIKFRDSKQYDFKVGLGQHMGPAEKAADYS